MVDTIVEIPIPGRILTPHKGSLRKGDGTARLPAFVAGPENRLIQVAVRSVLDDLDPAYSPIFLHGHHGTGKSHLALGLAETWKTCFRRRSVACTSAANFARELADAIQTKTSDDFSARYRQASLLVLEDIDALTTKEAAQRELADVLDARDRAGARVLLTGEKAPGDLAGIATRLRSRLSQGLVVPLAPPGRGARLVILQQLADLLGIEFGESVAEILADGLTITVPGLFEALVQLETSGEARVIDAETARRCVSEHNGSRRPSLREIAIMTARHFSLRLADLRSASRRQAVVAARGVAMYLARNLTPESLEGIGRYFGGRDHTTVSHGCRKTEQRLKTEPDVRDAVVQLRERLLPG